MNLDIYGQQVLAGWEDVFKKGQLTLWVLLALKDGNKYMGDIRQFIYDATNGILVVDDKSLYRALRRYYEAELTLVTTEPGDKGPERKVYSLSSTGRIVLNSFIERNVSSVFYKPTIKKLLEKE